MVAKTRFGTGCFIGICGTSGIGKSRFMTEAACQLDSTAVRVFLSCGRYAKSPSLSSQFARSLPRGGSKSGRSLESKLRTVTKTRALLVAIDDIDRATPKDIALIERVVTLSREMPIVVMTAYTPTHGDPPPSIAVAFQQWLYSTSCALNLRPLALNESKILGRCLAPGCAEPVLDRAVEAASGNPRYLEELLAAAACAVATPDFLPAAARVAATTLRTSLSRNTWSVLSAASALDVPFDWRWLLSPKFKPSIVTDALQEGVDSDIIRESSTSPDHFEFCDDAVRRCLYLSLVRSKRQELHKRLATVIESSAFADRNDALIGHQLLAAGLPQRAIPWLSRAADRRFDQKDLGGALHLYDILAPLIPFDAPREERIIQCLLAQADFSSAETRCRALAERYADVDCSVALAKTLLRILSFRLEAVDVVGAKAMYEELCSITSSDCKEYVTRASLLWARFLSETGDRASAKRMLRGEAAPSLSTENRLHYLVSVAMVFRDSFKTGRVMQLLDRAARLTDECPVRARAACYLMATITALHHGELEIARKQSATAMLIANKDASDHQAILFAHLAAVDVAVMEGNFRSAAESFGIVSGVSGMAWHAQALLFAFGTFIGLRRGDSALVRAFFRPEILDRAASELHVDLCGTLAYCYAEAYVEHGMEHRLAELLHDCVRQGVVDFRCWIPLMTARFGDLSDIESARASIITRKTQTGAAVAVAALHLFNAFVAQRARNTTHVIRESLAAATEYCALEMPWMQALALEVAGQVEAARALYRECGATRDYERSHRRWRSMRVRAPFGAALTARENEVAEQALRGETDRSIARLFGISRRTVEHHLRAAYSKLGIRARWQLNEQMLLGATTREQRRGLAENSTLSLAGRSTLKRA
ncbi:MAG: LuxR C-terminal-related transcriptional regulator [Candidatus Cybelea sp.]